MAGRIFISYRRDDAPGDARSIRDRLAAKFGKSNIFMDVDNLLAGQRFDRELDKALAQCDVLIAILGPRWMELLSEHEKTGGRDFVRAEIAAALKRDIIVIPVLIGREGRMPVLPHPEELPEDIRELVLYQKHNVLHESFRRDAEDLTTALGKVMRARTPARPWRKIAAVGAAAVAVLAVAIIVYRSDWLSSPAPRPRSEEATVVAKANEHAPTPTTTGVPPLAADTPKPVAPEPAKPAVPPPAKPVVADIPKPVTADPPQRVVDTPKPDPVTDCDRLAASPSDRSRPAGVPGVDIMVINTAAATAACDDAMKRYPQVARFIYEAGRTAAARKDFGRALELYRAAADKGSAAALNGTGVLYINGFGVPRDYAEGRKLFEKAAALGNADAIANIGLFYVNGWGVTRDDAEARKWFGKGAALGSPSAMQMLGALYARGQGGAKDLTEARKWFEKAAALGNPRAMTILGVMDEQGEGVAQNYEEAVKWYERAAALGDTTAMVNLGTLYDEGRGVGMNLMTAEKWYQKAADAGNEEAKGKLAKLR